MKQSHLKLDTCNEPFIESLISIDQYELKDMVQTNPVNCGKIGLCKS